MDFYHNDNIIKKQKAKFGEDLHEKYKFAKIDNNSQ